MRERFRQQSPRNQRRRATGAIATPICLAIVGGLCLLPAQRLQASDGRPTDGEQATLMRPRRDPLVNGIGVMAIVASGVVLALSRRGARAPSETVHLSGADLSGTDFSGADLSGAELSDANLSDADLSGANLSGADLNYANLSGANLSGAKLNGANLISVSLGGANLSGTELRYADLSGADLRYANLRRADLRQANLSGVDLNCAFLSEANLSEANLSGALLFYINSRDVQNLEPLQLEAQPSPFLCHVALPSYSQQPRVNPNRDCDRIPHLLSARYHISLEEAQGIVDEARQHRWD